MGAALDLLCEAAAIDASMNRWNSPRFREIMQIVWLRYGIDYTALCVWLGRLQMNNSEDMVQVSLASALAELAELKTEERSERNRRLAIVNTQVEQALAYYMYFVVQIDA